MNRTEKEAMSIEINASLKKCIETMSKMYPGVDIELQITKELMGKHAASIRQSEIDHFKNIAITSLGTDHEIQFDNAEMGFLQAALTDGKRAFKEFIESIPVESPICDDGTKMTNRGTEKKT